MTRRRLAGLAIGATKRQVPPVIFGLTLERMWQERPSPFPIPRDDKIKST